MKKLFFLLFFYFLFKIGISQNLSSISGQVIDSKTKEPLPGTVIFLAQTSIGIYADDKGLFTLDKIPSGKYDLTASLLGYKLFSKPLLFSGNSIREFSIELESAPTLLPAVTVISRVEKQSRFDYNLFLKYFLGQTSNASKCRIINPEDIYVYREKNKLVAEARKPIIIKNTALGYLIHYELKEFTHDPTLQLLTFFGIPRFEELIPSSNRQKEKWTKERDRAFYGSTQHFLLSLKHRELSSNFYRVHNSDEIFLRAEDLIKDSLFYYKKEIYVSFDKELPEIYFHSPSKTSHQLSVIIFTGAPVKIYENGYFEDFHSLIFDGYIGWSSAVAELVPFGYQPAHKLKKIKN